MTVPCPARRADMKLLITVEFEMDPLAPTGDQEWLIDKFGEVIRDEAYNTGLTKFCHTDTLIVEE